MLKKLDEYVGKGETPSKKKKYTTHEKILEEYSKELDRYVNPIGENVFGFWMQTIADLQFLTLELESLTKDFVISPPDRAVKMEGDLEFIRRRIAHLDRVSGKPSVYCSMVDKFGDTNAYALHNLYPFKGKFYPRIVRTLINALGLTEGDLILDPFNGSGTTTHEASLMGIESVGVDITPMGTWLAEIKNELPFLNEDEISFSMDELAKILKDIENKTWGHPNPTIFKLMLVLYFDTVDAFARTTRYNKLGKTGLFYKKYNYIYDCYKKLMAIKEEFDLKFAKAKIIHGDVLDLKKYDWMEEKFDAVITSPPYYLSIDYVGKDKIAYDYLGVNMREVKSKYLGMKNSEKKLGIMNLPPKVVTYYEDLRESIENIYWSLKSCGKMAIIVGDSTVNGKKIPTTVMTIKLSEEIGFKFHKLVFNPLLGARNRAIRGESTIICTK